MLKYTHVYARPGLDRRGRVVCARVCGGVCFTRSTSEMWHHSPAMGTRRMTPPSTHLNNLPRFGLHNYAMTVCVCVYACMCVLLPTSPGLLVSRISAMGLACCHGTHGDPGTRRRGLWQTGYLMKNKRRRYRNTGKDIYTGLHADINNNPHVTWGRTD